MCFPGSGRGSTALWTDGMTEAGTKITWSDVERRRGVEYSLALHQSEELQSNWI